MHICIRTANDLSCKLRRWQNPSIGSAPYDTATKATYATDSWHSPVSVEFWVNSVLPPEAISGSTSTDVCRREWTRPMALGVSEVLRAASHSSLRPRPWLAHPLDHAASRVKMPKSIPMHSFEFRRYKGSVSRGHRPFCAFPDAAAVTI
jgi:hypothetical protein